MSLFQLHGLVPAGTSPRHSQTPHDIMRAGPINALVSLVPDQINLDDLPSEKITEWTLRHHAVLAAYCANTTVIPIAINTVFSSKAAIRRQLNASAGRYTELVKTYAGVREFTVQLNITRQAPPAPETAQSGRDFLKIQRQQRDARLGAHQERQSFARLTLDALRDHAIQIQPSGPERNDRLIDCVILIDSKKIVHLRNLTGKTHDQANILGLDFVVTGPWPLYSCPAINDSKDEVHSAVNA